MFNFKEELSRYQPIMEIDHIQSALHTSEMQDLLDILQHIAQEKKQPPKQA